VRPLKWWQKAVFYQIYPRSFADANGDGIGDLPGIIGKLGYLKDLGIDAIWLSPHFPSPLYDCGYDVADYTGVAPEYGSLDAFRRFLDGAHRRGMHVILDMVFNHTSDQHAWFVESASSRDNPKADWYVWRDGRNGGPPNNWQSTFGGDAWEFVPCRGQYYYHYFFKQQPDLNWHNPEVKEAMFDAVRFWFDMGVDGFRLDAIGTIFEHPDMRDHPVPMNISELRHLGERAQTAKERAEAARLWNEMFQYQWGQAGLHELMQELRSVADEYDDRVLVAEDDNLAFHGDGHNELHMVFNFPLMRHDKLTPAWVRENQRQRLAALAKISPDAWPCNPLGNHDSPRMYNRYGDGQHDAELARLHLALLLTLRGTPFLYNGEEIGMTDFMLTDIRHFRDVLGSWFYKSQVEEMGVPPAEALQYAARLTRDKCRTPMQWDNAPNGGFCPAGVEPWLPVNPNYAQGVNVAEQDKDLNSLLNYYRRLLRLRRETPALVEGEYVPLRESDRDCLAFLRRTKGQTCLVALNMSERRRRLRFELPARQLRTLFSSMGERSNVTAKQNGRFIVPMQPHEAFIAELE
jgi:alpha-glucosidase